MLVRLLFPRVNDVGGLDPAGKVLDVPELAGTALVTAGVATARIDPEPAPPAAPAPPVKLARVRFLEETLVGSQIHARGSVAEIPASVAEALSRTGAATGAAPESPKTGPGAAPNKNGGGK